MENVVSLKENVPEALLSVKTKPLFVMHLDVTSLHAVGGTKGAARRIGVVPSGVFEGERLSGAVLDGGSDWQTLRDDGATLLDVRLVLKTHDGALIGMTYPGIRHGPAEILEKITRGEAVDPTEYYFRITPTFTTSAPQYEWLNRILAVGLGHRIASGPIYSVFEVL
jgi:hypothetical protein